MNKLPQEFGLVITREMGDDDWRLDQLLDIFKRELEVRDRAGGSTVNKGQPPPPKPKRRVMELHMPCLAVVMLTVPPALSVGEIGENTYQGIAKQYLMH